MKKIIFIIFCILLIFLYGCENQTQISQTSEVDNKINEIKNSECIRQEDVKYLTNLILYQCNSIINVTNQCLKEQKYTLFNYVK